MNDPYRILNVSPSASDDAIKKAYRNLARQYHPDNFAGTAMAELAEEKMKEINDAYEMIVKSRKQGTTPANDEFDANTMVYARVRRMINDSQIDSANATLDYISPTARGAEWNFLKGCIMKKFREAAQCVSE